MGYTLVPIAMDLKTLSTALGAGNRRLLSTLVRKFRGEFEQIDDMAAEFFDDEELDGTLTVRDALRQMIMGEEYRTERGLGFVYGYALQFLCHHLGEELPNEWWRTTSSWPVKQHVDRELVAARVSQDVLSTGRLVGRGAPISLPEIQDFPAIGYLHSSEIQAALSAWPKDVISAVEDEDVRGALAVLRGWLTTCADRGCDLICFEA